MMLVAACTSDSPNDPGVRRRVIGQRRAPPATRRRPPKSPPHRRRPMPTITPVVGAARRSPPIAARPTRPPARSPTCRASTSPPSASIVDVLVAKREGLLRRPVPRRRPSSQLLDRQLPADRRQRGAVLLRRLVQRGRRLRRPQRRRVRRPRRRRAHGHRRADRQGRAEHRARRPQGQDDRRQGRDHPVGRGDVEAGRPHRGQGLPDGAARRLRPEGAHRDPGDRRLPGFKSNEPLQLAAAGIPFKLYDPADYGIPGSFGVLYTNSTFLADFPTAAEDFMRASMKGLADALGRPAGRRRTIAVDMINANGNALAPVARGRDRPLGCRVEADRRFDGQRPADRCARHQAARATKSTPTPTSACSTVRCPTSPRWSTRQWCRASTTTPAT